MATGRANDGFTLVELMIAMTILAMLSLGLYGVVTVGARAASAGERRTEQARRMRIATGLILRQLHAAVPLRAPSKDGELLPFFEGERNRLVFVTSQPQAPDATGLAVVEYRQDGDRLVMTERPYYLVLAEDFDIRDVDSSVLETTLLFDVRSVKFSYRRSDFSEGSWDYEWSAADEDSLPAVVSVVVEPSVPGGPVWAQEIPLFVGVFNEITGEQDFSRRDR